MSDAPTPPAGSGPPDEADALADVEQRLRAERPVPAAAFRAMLRQSLVADAPEAMARPAPPRRLRLLITAYAAAGVALLTVAGVGVLGGGPLSA
jgi:hypothetical protein